MVELEPVRVGIVGGNPDRGWASRTHLPVAAALPEIDLVAVATTRPESARAAAERFGARHAFASARELIACDAVEAVTVAVNVPQHHDLVAAAVAAGKHVFCEWPLGQDTAQAVALRDAATVRGVRTIVGLQAARSAAVRHVRGLIDDGYVGALAGVSLRVAAALGGARYPAALAWLADRRKGTNLLTVTTGHALDTVAALVGEPHGLRATVATRVTDSQVAETGAPLTVTSPDQIAISGTIGAGAAAFTALVVGGVSACPGFEVEIRGDAGILQLASRPSLTAADFVLHGARNGEDLQRRELPPDPARRLPAVAAPVAALYRDLATTVRTAGDAGPDFAHAVRRHELLDALAGTA